MLDPFNSENHFRWRLQCSKSEKMIWNGTTMTRCYWLGRRRRRPTPKVEVFSGRIFILLYTPEIVNYPDTEAALQERDCWKMSLDRIKTKVPAQSQGSLNFATHSHPGWMDGSSIQNCLCMCVCRANVSPPPPPVFLCDLSLSQRLRLLLLSFSQSRIGEDVLLWRRRSLKKICKIITTSFRQPNKPEEEQVRQ